MANLAEDFLVKFHSLDGITIAQRRKKCFILLHQNASLAHNTEALDAISAGLTPKTFLESLFQVELLIFFRRTQELLQLLKQGNDVLVSKIAKQVWFFKEAFNGVAADDLVNEILPNMSFSVRMKVLRKLSRYSENFDEIFAAVEARYGIFLAFKFITGCSAAKIRELLTEHSINLTSTQLKIIFKKDPDLIDLYFTDTRRSRDSAARMRMLKFIFGENRNYFDYLQNKMYFSLKFGRRTSKKIVDFERDRVIKCSLIYYHLNNDAIMRKLGKDYVQLFYNCLPMKIETFDAVLGLLLKIPKKYRYKYLKLAENHYNIKFMDHPSLIDQRFLKLIPDNSERALLAKVKVDEGHDDYLKYLLTQDSIPLIKQKINLTSSISERGNLIEDLIRSCNINNDIDALQQVMKYFCFRHKNDEMSVHLQFINNIETFFGFKKFNEEMWNYLNELLTIHMLKFDQDLPTYQKIQTLPLIKFNRGTSNHQKLSYLEFLFNKNEQIDELILEYFTTTSDFPWWGRYSHKFEKYFFLYVINNYRENAEKDQIIFNCSLITQINMWNECYRDDTMSFYDFPTIVDSFNNVIRNHSYISSVVVTALKSKIFTTKENSYRNEYLQIYWERFDIYGTLKDMKWFLKYDPLIILHNLDKFVTKIVDSKIPSQLNIWHIVKKSSHLQLDDNSVQFCLGKLSDDKCLDKKTKFITCLSVVMKPENFVAVANTYKPANKALDLKNETELRLYTLQCEIAQNFKNTRSHEALDSLLNYCAGDYFKYSMRSLYSILYRTPENALPQYLNHLAKKAVSVRKHALYLTCELTTTTRVEKILKLLNKQEGVQSLQKYMFASTLKYFVKNPSNRFFEMVTLNMLFIKKEDEESLNSITDNVTKIPIKYQARYVQQSWEYFEKTVEIWEKLKPLKEKLLRVISVNQKIIQELSLDFGLKIINDHFFASVKVIPWNSLSAFMFAFVINRDEVRTILAAVLTIVSQSNDRNEVFKFFHDWYEKIMIRKNEDLTYFQPFLNFFEKIVVVTDNFYDHIKLFLLKMKLELPKDEYLGVLSNRIVAFLTSTMATYGSHVMHLVYTEIKSNMQYFIIRPTANIYDICNDLIRRYPSPIVAVLVLEVISKPARHEFMKLFNDILRQIKNINDTGVQICLQCKFASYLASSPYFADNVSDMETD